MQGEYRIRVRKRQGQNFRFIGEVDNWINLEIQMPYNEVGAWEIELSADSDPAKLFLEIASDGTNNGQGGVYIERNGYFLLSGPMTEITESVSENGRTLKVIGSCDLQYIADKLAMPHPQTFRSPYMTLDGTSKGGHSDYIPDKGSTGSRRASWHIHTAVRTNIGEAAPEGRPPVRFLTTQDNGVGVLLGEGEYTIARGENLFELCKGVADYSDASGVGIRMIAHQYATGSTDNMGFPEYRIKFECVSGKTRFDAIFSPEQGTVGNYTYTRKRPETNTILIGGSGEGSARRFYYGWDSDSIKLYGTIESFQEYTGIATGKDNIKWAEEKAKLTSEVQRLLGEYGEQTTFTFEFHETPKLRYGEDFELGDRVYIRMRGKETGVRVRHVSFLVSGNEEKIDLMLGNQSSIYRGLRLFDNVEQLKSRYSGLTKRSLGE